MSGPHLCSVFDAIEHVLGAVSLLLENVMNGHVSVLVLEEFELLMVVE